MSTPTNLVHDAFIAACAKSQAIEFNPAWCNGTGYFDHAVWGEHSPRLQRGEQRSCADQHGRTLLLIGTRFGNLVIFERYAARGEPTALVSNEPEEIRALFTGCFRGALREHDLDLALGAEWKSDDNLGFRLERLLK